MTPPGPPKDRVAELGDYYAANAARLHATLARHFGGSNRLAEEALQIAFTRLAGRPDIVIADAGGWLFTVARNEGYHLTELAGRVDSLDFEAVMPAGENLLLVDMVAGPEDTEQIVEDRDRLAALDELTPDQALTLRQYAQGYSYAEIGELNGHSPSKVDHSMKRGRAALRAREAQIERETDQHIEDSREPAAGRASSELDERRRRVQERRERAEIDLGLEIGR